LHDALPIWGQAAVRLAGCGAAPAGAADPAAALAGAGQHCRQLAPGACRREPGDAGAGAGCGRTRRTSRAAAAGAGHAAWRTRARRVRRAGASHRAGADVPVRCAGAAARRADRASRRCQPRSPDGADRRVRARQDPEPGDARSVGRRDGRPAVADRRRRRGASMRALLAWMWPMFRQRWRALLPACALALVTAAAAVGLLGVSGWFLTATALVSGALAMFNLFVPSAMVRGLAFT